MQGLVGIKMAIQY